MQKPANRILGALLVLVMIITMLPATVFATSETDVFAGWSLTLGEDIGVNFYLSQTAADYTVDITVAGNEAAYTTATKDGYYVVSVNVAAAQMTDLITLTVTNGEQVMHTGEYSVRQYAEIILTGAYDDEVKQMAKQMLNLGAAAQTYFAYNTGMLANKDYEIDTPAAVPTEVPAIALEDDLDGISLYGMSLLFQSKTAVRFYFVVNGNVADYTFKVKETEYTPVKKDDLYYVEVGNINPQDLGSEITVTVNDALTVSYNPLTYIVRKYNSDSTSAALKNLVQALYGYHLEALEYQEYQRIIQVGALQQHSNNTPWVKSDSETFIYFNTDAYTATTGEYTSLTADAIKLVRGGEVYSVANPGQGLLVKDNDTQHLLKITPWGMTGGHLPIQAHDYFIIEGRFESTSGDGTTIQIAKSYVYFDGTNVEISTTEPILPKTIDAGVMSHHSANGWASNGVYASMAENAAPYNGWNIEYTPVAAENLKLIRGGETYNIGFPGRGTLVKYNATDYFLKMEWNVGEYAPMQDGDILIVEGGFVNEASKVTLNISKTYIYANGSNVEFSTEMPTLTTVIDAGTMSAHSTTGWKSSADAPGNLLFAMADNDAPSGYYRPTDASNVQLIRGGNTYVVGHNLRDTISKENNAQYVFEFWTIADHKPMVANDILVVEGDFYQESTKTMLNISKTYILLNADGTATFSTEMPTLATVIDAGVMSSHSNGWSADALYFSMAENEAPVGDAIRYTPEAASNLKLIRDGVTYDVGHTARETIVKASDTGYYIALWVFGDYKPLVANDILVVEGNFTNAANKTTLNISKSYVLINADGTATFSTEMPTLQTVVDAGAMSGHEDGSASEIYFSLSENAVPVDENAETAYAGSVQLVRSGAVSTVSANIYKLDEGYYYLELDGVELADGDYLVVEGAFSNANNGYTMNITKTYVLVDGETLVYSETEPVPETVYPIGSLSDHSNGMAISSSETLIYGTADANDAPGGDWSYEYTPMEAGGLKLIRDGVTYEVGVNGQGTIIKYNSTDYCIKLAPWTVSGSKLPIVPGDIVVIEGSYTLKSDSTVVVTFAPTYVLVTSETTVKLLSAMPNLVSGGAMGGHNNARTANGFYATMAANNAPYSDWSLRYKPLAADVVKFVSGETTTNVANTGGEMLVKYSDTEYFFEGWTLSGTFADAVGNTYIINGLFYNAANDVYIDIDTTYVDITETDEMFYHIDAGMIGSHANGTGGDGVYATLAANAAPYDGWNIEYAPMTADAYRVIRDGVETSIGMPGRGTLVKYGETDYYLKTSGWCVNNFTATTNDVFIIDGYWAEKNSSDPVLKMEKTYLYHDGTAWVFSTEEPVQKTVVDVVELGSHSNGWSTGGFYFTAAANDAPYDTTWALRYKPVSADVIKCISGETTTNVGNTGGETIVKYSETEYYVEGWTVGSANLVAGNTFVIEGQFYNAANDVYMDVEKTYIILNADGTTTVLTDADKYINAGAMSAYTQNWFDTNYTALYFVLASNNAPADEGWAVRYMPNAAANVKLVRGGTTYTIGNTGAETIVKITDGTYALALDSWWWSAYAPIQDGDQLIIEGEFSNASNGYILNITKTYITFVSNAEDNVIFSAAADTDFGDVLLPSTNDTLTIGVWNGSYHVFENKQLQELQAAGITKIMGINPIYTGYGEDVTDAEMTEWLDRVYSYGISVIIDLRDWDGTTVPGYASHEGLIGFLMYDEPSTKNFSDLADLKEKFDAIDAFDGKLFYVNLFPECAADSSLFGSTINIFTDYDKYYVTKFLETLDIEVLSWDNYSLVTDSTKTETGIRTDYFHNFEVMAAKNKTLWYTMLSAGHGTSHFYNTPTAEELRWQMAVAMTYGISNIDHYVYTSHESDYSCMAEYETWEPTDLYYDIKDVDNEYLAWDNIYMAYDWIGVGTYSANSNNSMLTQLENSLTLSDYGITATSASENLLIGVFGYNGTNAYMVTNAGSAGSTTVGSDGKNFSMADTSVTLTLADGDYKCAAVIDNGEITFVAVNNNQVTLNVEAYEGVFVIPVLN